MAKQPLTEKQINTLATLQADWDTTIEIYDNWTLSELRAEVEDIKLRVELESCEYTPEEWETYAKVIDTILELRVGYKKLTKHQVAKLAE